LRATSHQSGYEPGAQVQLTATLAESGVPMHGHATVWAEIAAPGNQSMQINFTEHEPGMYRGSFIAAHPGLYRSRVRAAGNSLRGLPFRREQTLTNAVWVGGNSQSGPGGTLEGKLCHLLNCLLGPKGAVTAQLEELLRRLGLDINSIRRCLSECAESRIPLSERNAVGTASYSPYSPATPPAAQVSPALLSLLEQLLKSSQGGNS